MSRRIIRGGLVFALVAVWSCSTSKSTRRYKEPPPPDIRPTVIQYVDSDAFDRILETALVTQDPVIVIQTGSSKPDWSGRLNAWIAAWNMGGKVVDDPGTPKARGQAPIPKVVVDGDSIREFRLLIGGFMNRIEDIAKASGGWLVEERTKSRRVALLKPYNLRFHLDGNDTIQIMLFNGRYSQYYRNWVKSIAAPDVATSEEWCRGFCCSQCREHGGKMAATYMGPEKRTSHLPETLPPAKRSSEPIVAPKPKTGPPARLTGEILELDDDEN